MSYDSYRKAKIQGYYDAQLETLVSGFDPRRPTVLLLPGGMGSQLERTEHPVGKEPNVINDVIWVDWGIFRPKKDAVKLEIQISGGAERDRIRMSSPRTDPEIHHPNAIRGVEGSRSRREMELWRVRLRLAQAARGKLGLFQAIHSRLQKRIVALHNLDPIPNLTIVCHSMGGMVCTYA